MQPLPGRRRDFLNECEERVIGTDPCVADTDGDGLSDFVEVISRTNPLVPEDLSDTDRDGTSNADEVTGHTDPLSNDGEYRADRGYVVQVSDAAPTPDGRACYHVRATNVSLVATQARPDALGNIIAAGTNDILLYFQVRAGRNDPHGVGIAETFEQRVIFIAAEHEESPRHDRRHPGPMGGRTVSSLSAQAAGTAPHSPRGGPTPHPHAFEPPQHCNQPEVAGFSDPDERRGFCSLAPSLLRKGPER